MSQQDAFLSAIREAPDDDTPRLVLADWLEDHGDPDRAEFIRVQCRLAPGGEALDPEVRAALQARQQALLDRHGGAWLGSLWHRLPWRMAWHRGLLSAHLSRRLQAEEIH